MGSSASVKLIKSQEELLELSKRLHKAKKSIVFTNGCFDILHVGHVRLLEQARTFGDCLVIGINSDQSVRALKGDSRPIVTEMCRAEILSALESVDFVFIFSEQTPITTILNLKPDIHVKGGDYNVEDLPEKDAVYAHQGKIVIIPLIEGWSTTSIVTHFGSK